MFEEMARGSSLRMVQEEEEELLEAIPVYAMAESDQGDPEGDELYQRHKDQRSKEDESQQAWKATSIEIPSPGRMGIQVKDCQQEWTAEPVEIPSSGPIVEFW